MERSKKIAQIAFKIMRAFMVSYTLFIWYIVFNPQLVNLTTNEDLMVFALMVTIAALVILIATQNEINQSKNKR